MSAPLTLHVSPAGFPLHLGLPDLDSFEAFMVIVIGLSRLNDLFTARSSRSREGIGKWFWWVTLGGFGLA